MGWLIVTIILGVIGIASIIFFGIAGPTRGSRLGGWAAAGVCAFVWGILTFFLSIHSVGQRQVGVVYNFSGTIAGSRSPGVVWTAPWQHIRTESTAVTKEVFVFGDQNSAVSKDQQPITAELVVNYQVSPNDAVALLKDVGPSWPATLLDGRVPQDFKEITATFSSPQLTLERARLHDEVRTRLQAEMCPNTGKEPWCVNILDIFISNLDYSNAYKAAIEAKQVQVQQALQAQAKVAQATAEAEQAVATAKGQAESTLVKAKADAEALSVKGRALHDNPEILQLEAIDKLNPNAEVIICTGSGQGNCPSFLPQVPAK